MQDACEVGLWSSARAALERNEEVELKRVLLAADRQMADSTSIRFSMAIAAMNAKRYACALSAWDDEGSDQAVCVWSDVRVAENVPSSKESAETMIAVCVELLQAHDRLQALEQQRGPEQGASHAARALDDLGSGLDAMAL